jgi:cytochrome c-type biogenesis protein CcmH/NrfF
MLTGGMSIQAVQKAYAAKFGSKSLALPPNEGWSRAIWAAPLLLLVGAALVMVRVARRWVKRGQRQGSEAQTAPDTAPRDAYDDKLDRELSDLDKG